MLKLLATDTRAIDPVQGPIREKLGLVAQAVVDFAAGATSRRLRHRRTARSFRCTSPGRAGNQRLSRLEGDQGRRYRAGLSLFHFFSGIGASELDALVGLST